MSFPNSWSCDNDRKRVKVEVFVDTQTFGPFVENTWQEIPTVTVNSFVDKSDLADVVRTAQVVFPVEWDNESVLNLLTEFTAPSGYQYARVWFKDDRDKWILQHIGFVGALGGTERSSAAQFWVYDISHFLKGVPADYKFIDPTPEFVLETVADELNSRTPALMVTPFMTFSYESTTEVTLGYEFAPASAFYFNPFATTFYFNVTQGNKTVADYDAPLDFIDWDNAEVTGEFTTQKILTGSTVRELPIFSFGAKKFQPNRDSLTDVMEWLSVKTGGKWHVEPTPNGGTILLDSAMIRRPFVQESVADEMIDDAIGNDIDLKNIAFKINNLPIYDRVRVIKNNALYEISPINTVEVKGEMSRRILGQDVSDIPIAKSIAQPSKEFPYVKARASSLYGRAIASSSAENAEMAINVVESDDTTLSEAENTARSVLLEELQNSAQGEILIYGNPNIMPYDSITAYPMCAGKSVLSNIRPLKYEVQSVKHHQSNGGVYITTLYVSLYVDENDIEIVESRMIE